MKKILAILLLTTASTAFAASPYAGASVGYLTDNKEAFYAAHLGFDIAKSEKLLQGVEAEIGYTSDRGNGVKDEIMPLMVNYRLTLGANEPVLSYFGGVGIGSSDVKLSGYGLSDSSWALTLQAFAGVNIKVAQDVAVRLAVRYIWIDDVTLFGYNTDVGDDVAVEAGVCFRF